MHRRTFMSLAGAALAAPAVATRSLAGIEEGRPLPIPPVLDLTGQADAPLEAIAGETAFLDGGKARTLGFNQSYLGPVLRVRRGEIARPVVRNRLPIPVTSHWHGLHVPGDVDGGPQLEIAPEAEWRPELGIDQPEATLWYHSHVHGQTGPQVYYGLAGMLLVTDPGAVNPALPADWGLDDIPVIIQDRMIGADGNLIYDRRGPFLMHGFRGNEVMVNGALRPVASVARGLVRLRLLNGSNARIYTLAFEDGRSFEQIASDGGYLPAPLSRRVLTLAPAERAEIVVDFSDGAGARLVSLPDFNSPMGGMMGRGMMGRGMMGRGMGQAEPEAVTADGAFLVLSLMPDRSAPPGRALPAALAGAPDPLTAQPARTRTISLDMGPAAMRRGAGPLAINGRAYDMGRIDFAAPRDEVELWRISTSMMAHPFHVHGTSFTVLSRDGKPVPFAESGAKDVVLVSGTAEILVRFPKQADRRTPYMFHCHILEHEDGGMMGQFTVS